MRNDTPLPAFHFTVSFEGLPGDNGSDNQFMSISGLRAGNTTDGNPLRIGDQLIVNKTLILQRAVRGGKISPLRKWILKDLAKPSASIKEMQVTILDEEHQPGIVFRLKGINAAGWELGELNAGKSELLMETIFLRYGSLMLAGK